MLDKTEKLVFFVIFVGLAVIIWARVYSQIKSKKFKIGCGCQKNKSNAATTMTVNSLGTSALTNLQ